MVQVQKGLLGVIGQALNSGVAEKFGVLETEGFYISEIEKGFGADISGLKPGDRWCVCARTWNEAAKEGVACPVVLASTHEESLQVVPIELLNKYSHK